MPATLDRPTPTQRRQRREAGILAALAAGPATVAAVAASDLYDGFAESSRYHAARDDLGVMVRGGLSPRWRPRSRGRLRGCGRP